jgi:hypothetical protein
LPSLPLHKKCNYIIAWCGKNRNRKFDFVWVAPLEAKLFDSILYSNTGCTIAGIRFLYRPVNELQTH